MTYGIRILQGEAPKSGGPSSLFIYTIGRPLTPMSIAGVHRRHRRLPQPFLDDLGPLTGYACRTTSRRASRHPSNAHWR